jgi:hypothetical protein
MSSREPGSGEPSGILDAVKDKAAGNSSRTSTANRRFRAKTLNEIRNAMDRVTRAFAFRKLAKRQAT